MYISSGTHVESINMPKARKSVRETYEQLRKDVLGGWLDFPGLLKDRREILADSSVVLHRPTGLKNKPLKFATQWLLLPAALLGSLSAFVAFVVDPPVPQIERALKSQEKLETVLKEAAEKFGSDRMSLTEGISEYEKLSDQELEDLVDSAIARINKLKEQPKSDEQVAELRRETSKNISLFEVRNNRAMLALSKQAEKARKEARENQALLKSIAKVTELEEKFRPLIVSVALVLNSIFFARLVRKKFPKEKWTAEAHAVHLYIVATLLAPVVASAGILGVLLEYAIRYEIEWYFDFHNIFVGMIGIWGLFQMRAAAKRISLLRAEVYGYRESYKLIANRLILSNMVSQIAVLLVTVCIDTIVFGLVYSRALASVG